MAPAITAAVGQFIDGSSHRMADGLATATAQNHPCPVIPVWALAFMLSHTHHLHRLHTTVVIRLGNSPQSDIAVMGISHTAMDSDSNQDTTHQALQRN